MTDEAKKPDHLKIVPEEQLDEEEAEFRSLRRDVPGAKGAAGAGTLTIGVGKQPTPRNIFYRTHSTFRPIIPMVNVEVGMDHHFIAVMPHMVEPLAGMGITVTDHTLYLVITEDGGLRIIPVRGVNSEGEQNEWDRTKEMSLLAGEEKWVRMYSDRPNNAYKCFPAPKDRFGEPKWPDPFKPAKIVRMAFKDKGWLIDSAEHILVQRWAGRDGKK
jgi:hypothetical protein